MSEGRSPWVGPLRKAGGGDFLRAMAGAVLQPLRRRTREG